MKSKYVAFIAAFVAGILLAGCNSTTSTEPKKPASPPSKEATLGDVVAAINSLTARFPTLEESVKKLAEAQAATAADVENLKKGQNQKQSCRAVCPNKPHASKKAPPQAHRKAVPQQPAPKPPVAAPLAVISPPPQQPPAYLPPNPPAVKEKECCTPLPKAAVIREEKARVCGIAIQTSVSDATIVGRLQLDEDPANPGKIRIARVKSFEGVAIKVSVSPYQHSKMRDGKGDCDVDQATIYQHWPEVVRKFELPIDCVPVKG